MTDTVSAHVTAVSRNDVYSFSKPVRDEIVLLAGLGVEGDIHAGVTVRHRSRMRADPTRPNLRQVHLIHAELHEELGAQGYDVPAGALGENVTTRGLDLLALPRGTVLRFGGPAAGDGGGPDRPDGRAAVEITGLRNPCVQIDKYRTGLLKKVLGKDEDGNPVRRAGIMGVVLHGGPIRPGDPIAVELPVPPHVALDRV